jgi:hypothetical protein
MASTEILDETWANIDAEERDTIKTEMSNHAPHKASDMRSQKIRKGVSSLDAPRKSWQFDRHSSQTTKVAVSRIEMMLAAICTFNESNHLHGLFVMNKYFNSQSFDVFVERPFTSRISFDNAPRNRTFADDVIQLHADCAALCIGR